MKDFKLTDLQGIGPVTVKKLENAGINTPLDIVVRGTKEFSRISGLAKETALKHVTNVKKMLLEDGVNVKIRDVEALKELRKKQIKVPLNVEELDDMTRGGFETQSIYEIYGKEGSGKTQVSMTLAAETLHAGYGVMFIDCEGTFDLDRLSEIYRVRYDEDLPEEKLGYQLYDDSLELQDGLNNIIGELIEKDVKFLIVDGLVGLMRLGYEGRGELGERQIELKDVLKHLRNMSLILNMGVIVTNQVTANPDLYGAKEKAIGGHVMGHYSKYIIKISPGLKNNRTARLEKSPKYPQADYSFFINEEGASENEKMPKKKKEKFDSIAKEDTSQLADKSLLHDEPSKIKVY